VHGANLLVPSSQLFTELLLGGLWSAGLIRGVDSCTDEQAELITAARLASLGLTSSVGEVCQVEGEALPRDAGTNSPCAPAAFPGSQQLCMVRATGVLPVWKAE
jgi:hypothetical protein